MAIENCFGKYFIVLDGKQQANTVFGFNDISLIRQATEEVFSNVAMYQQLYIRNISIRIDGQTK